MISLQLDEQKRRAAIAAGLVVAAVVAVRVVYTPLVRHLGAQRARLRELQTRIRETRSMADELASTGTSRVHAAGDDGAAAERMARDGQSVARVLEVLGAQAKRQGLELVALQPRTEDRVMPTVALGPSLTLRGVPLTLQLTGRYKALGTFLGTLPDAPFLAKIDRLVVARREAGSASLRAELQLSVFLSDQQPPS